MRRTSSLFGAGVGLALAVATPALAQPPTQRPPLGINAGAFYPTNSKTKNTFGGTWTQFGPGIGKVSQPVDGGALRPDLTILSNDRAGRRVFLTALGAEWRQGLGNSGSAAEGYGDGRSVHPYFFASVDLTLASINDGTGTRWKTGTGGGIGVGTTFGSRAFVEVGMRALSRLSGYDFSGTGFRVGVRF